MRFRLSWGIGCWITRGDQLLPLYSFQLHLGQPGQRGKPGRQAPENLSSYSHTRRGTHTYTHTHAQARTVGHSTESVSVLPRTAWDIFQSFSFAFAFLPCYFFCFSFYVFLFGLCLWAQRSKRDRTLQRATSVCWEIETKSQIENGNWSEAAAAAAAVARWARDKEQQREGERWRGRESECMREQHDLC